MTPTPPSQRASVLRLHSTTAVEPAGVSRAGNRVRAGTLRPALRLAGEAREVATAERTKAVEKENRLASGMTPDDARWVFARRVAENLEGGKAALLTPEKRRRLLATARRVGLRDFDANLVIAIVQDGRRSGKGGLNPDAEHSLLLIRPGDAARAMPEWARFAIAAVILGAIMAWAMARWVVGQP